MKGLIWKSMIFGLGVLMLTSGCTQLQKSDQIAVGKGNIVVKLTDAPFPVSLVDKAMVTIDKIEIHSVDSLKTDKNDTAKTTAFIVLSDKVQEFNLLDLRNSITADMLDISIGVGRYDIIRMHVVASKVILKDGTEFQMKIPGGTKSGLKIQLIPQLVVKSGIVNEVLIDFDDSKSFIAQGNIKSKKGIKGFMFKPVIRAMVEKQSGRIEGKVFENDTTLIEEAHVQILRADTVFSSALTDNEGRYALIGLPAGTFQVKCEKDSYNPVQVDQVVVKAQEKTLLDFKMTKLKETSGSPNI